MATKQCIKCGAILDESAFPFHNDRDGVVRFRNTCRACYNAAKRLRDRRYAQQKAAATPAKAVPAKKEIPENGDPKKFVPDIKDLVTAYLNLIHWKPSRLGSITLEQYNAHFNLEVPDDQFVQIQTDADARLEEFGYYNDIEREYPCCGTYLIIGDTFGTHTPAQVFDLMRLVVKKEGVDRVIVIGHNLDDENIISNLIGTLGAPTTIIAVKDELRDLHAQRGYGYDIVQEQIRIGNVVIRNQEHITPYTKSYIGNLDPMLFGGQMIVNCTRHELCTRPTPDVEWGRNFIASPGALADPHVVTIINRLIFANGNRAMLRPTNKDSYHKHRKNEVDKQLWERGYILLKGDHPYQRRIFNVEDEYRTIIGNGVYNNLGTEISSELTLVLSDLHAPYAHRGALAHIVPDNPKVSRIIFNGDVADCRSFNPHNAYEASHSNLQEELDELDELLERTLKSVSGAMVNVEFMLGNHEDFVRRFSDKYPQFAECFTKLLWDIYGKYGRVLGNDRTWADIGDTVVHHGSADVFGVSGNNMEQTARVFRKQAIIGHTHSPAIRFGCYRTGCLCYISQGYNNDRLSNWQIGYARVYSDDLFEYVELVNSQYAKRGN